MRLYFVRQIIQHSGVSVRILSGKQGKQRYLLTNSTVLHKVPFGSTGRCVNKEQDLWPPLADALSFSFGIPSRRAKARPLQKFNVPLLGFIGFKTQKTTSLALENHCGRWVLNGTQTLLLCVKVTSEASFSILNSAPQWNCLLGMYITPPLLSSSESFHIKPLRLTLKATGVVSTCGCAKCDKTSITRWRKTCVVQNVQSCSPKNCYHHSRDYCFFGYSRRFATITRPSHHL